MLFWSIWCFVKKNGVLMIPLILLVYGTIIGLIAPVFEKDTKTKVDCVVVSEIFEPSVGGKIPIYHVMINNKWTVCKHIYGQPTDNCYMIRNESISLLGIIYVNKSFLICY